MQLNPSMKPEQSTSPLRKTHILVAGLGNLLLRDNGVGVHAARFLLSANLPGILVAEIGTAVLDGWHLLEWADKILAIDAIQAGGIPGTVYSYCVTGTNRHEIPVSPHQFSLLSTLDLMSPLRKREVTILGVEPEIIDYGLDLSPAVKAAFPKIIAEVHTTLASWRADEERQYRVGKP
ncbi:MAG TPA: hydrogenase maturation protease [Terriglobia bacterium]|nr:hydrogenase maturation protease [Terriglobia bacterium]